MNANPYSYAGGAAIGAAFLMVPEVLLTLGYDMGKLAGPQVLLIIALLVALRTVMAAWAMLVLRDMLRERLDTQRLDRLIVALVIGSVVLAATAILARLPGAAEQPVAPAIGLLLVGLPVAVLSFLFGLRVLRLESDLGGLKAPFGWLHMLAPLCFATVILVPLGMLMLLAALVLLGMILLRSDQAQPDFV